jgi:hypothetical protein
MIGSNKTGTINALEGLLDELCSTDLTLGQAKLLRHRLCELLEALQGAGTRLPEMPCPR